MNNNPINVKDVPPTYESKIVDTPLKFNKIADIWITDNIVGIYLIITMNIL